MIEGLKVTIIGTELKTLCLEHANRLEEQAAMLSKQKETLVDAGFDQEGLSISNSPKLQLQDRVKQKQNEAAELRFIAEHLKLSEEYLLDRADLTRVGKLRSAY